MKWWKTVELGLTNLGGVSNLEDLYGEVSKIREASSLSIPPSLKAVVRKELEYNSSDSSNWRGDRDLFYSVHGIGMGVWGLRSELSSPPEAYDLNSDYDGESRRIEATSLRIIRDTYLARKIKALHRHRCQICGTSITLPDGQGYAEAHHIIPLGAPHNGPDTPSNIIVVCPNHHAQLDFGCIAIIYSDLRSAVGHTLSCSSIEYHNSEIFGKVCRSPV